MSEHKNGLSLHSFKLLFERLYPQLCLFACNYLNDLEASKALVQDVFIKVWENEVVFLNEQHSTDYFYKAVKQQCLKIYNLKTN